MIGKEYFRHTLSTNTRDCCSILHHTIVSGRDMDRERHRSLNKIVVVCTGYLNWAGNREVVGNMFRIVSVMDVGNHEDIVHLRYGDGVEKSRVCLLGG